MKNTVFQILTILNHILFYLFQIVKDKLKDNIYA